MPFITDISWIPHLGRQIIQRLFYRDVSLSRPPLSPLAEHPEHLPQWIRDTPLAMCSLQRVHGNVGARHAGIASGADPGFPSPRGPNPAEDAPHGKSA